MTQFTLDRADVRTLIWHAALYGLAAILDEAGHRDLRICWSGGMRPRGVVSGAGLSAQLVGEAVRRHAERRTASDSWVSRDFVVGGKPRGLMSPRISRLEGVWGEFRRARHSAIDTQATASRWLDLRMIHALGEPSDWSRNHLGQVIQDDGASRLEMQPRNQGSEFVANRLRKLATILSRRSPDAVVNGLVGVNPMDELGKDGPASSTPTGLANVGPTDNAVAWCAMWGIASLPTAPRVGGVQTRGIASTAGHLGGRAAEWFYAPVWKRPWTLARLRSVLVSKQLADTASRELALTARDLRSAAELTAGDAWLDARGVVGVCRFPIGVFGSSSAPERRALGATILSLKR